MWPLALTLLLTTAAPQQPQPQSSPAVEAAYVGQIPPLQQTLLDRARQNARRKLQLEAFAPNTCFYIRSYHFRRQDGLAPVPAGVTTCTPANVLKKRQISPSPGGVYVPLTLQQPAGESPEK